MTLRKIWTIWIPDAAELADRASTVLSVEERRRAGAFRQLSDQHRYSVAHVALRQILGELLGMRPSAVPIGSDPCLQCSGPHGKPHLPAYTGLHFSLSHASNVAMVAVGEDPVGVDVEVIPDDDRYLDLLGTLTRSEHVAIRRVPAEHRPTALTQCWVRKEALLKATGEGLAREPHLVSVGLGQRFNDTHETSDSPSGWRVVDLDAPRAYAAAIALTIFDYCPYEVTTGTTPLRGTTSTHKDDAELAPRDRDGMRSGVVVAPGRHGVPKPDGRVTAAGDDDGFVAWHRPRACGRRRADRSGSRWAV
jgi:4'-phosphopantetheinyl transferase